MPLDEESDEEDEDTKDNSHAVYNSGNWKCKFQIKGHHFVKKGHR